MHLELKNFRQHRSRTFDIPDEGLILLSGEIGSGKSTLLYAISYALYGNVRKPCSFGATTCSVLLQFKDVTIERNTRPNRLTFKRARKSGTKVYTDDEAQAAINRLFGPVDAFMTAVFVRQNIDCSILALKPVERVEFVKMLAFDSDDHTRVAEGIKRMTKEYETARLRIEGGADYLEREYSEMEEVVEESQDADKTIELIDAKIVKLRDEIGRNEKEIARVDETTRSIHAMVDSISSAKESLAAKRSQLQRLLTVYQDMYGALPDKFKVDAPNGGYLRVDLFNKDPLEEYVREAAEMESQRETYEAYVALQEKIEERDGILKRHTDSIRERLTALKKNMVGASEKKRIEKLKRRVERYEERASVIGHRDGAVETTHIALRRIGIPVPGRDGAVPASSVREMIALLDETLRDSAIISSCPKCKTSLAVDQTEDGCTLSVAASSPRQRRGRRASTGKRRLSADDRKELAELRTALAEFIDDTTEEITDEETASYREMKKEMTDLVQRAEVSELNQNLYADLKAQLKTPPTFVKHLDETIEELKAGVPDEYEPPKGSFTRNLVSITRAIDNARSLLRTADAIATAQQAVFEQEEEIRTLSREATSGDDSSESTPLTQHLTLLDAHRAEIVASSQAVRKKIDSLTQRRERYVDALNRQEEREKMATKLETMKAEVADIERHLLALGALGEMSKKAELQAMKRTLEALNTNAALYLEDMFEESMTIRLEFDMESKKKSLKIRVEYKGMEYDDIDQLSGGERQLCNLAFIMAVNELTGSKFLMLDECLNNLDEETNSDVLTYLRERAERRAIIIVSHEALRGIFDSVVEVGAE